MSELLIKTSERNTQCEGDKITVRHLREWLCRLPDEFQDVEFESCFGGHPVTLKRIVAYKSKCGGLRGVCVNAMGSHLPFDDSLEWCHVLS